MNLLDAVVVDREALAEQRRRFDEFGYVVLENVLDEATIVRLKDAIESIRTELEASTHRNRDPRGLNVRPVVDKHPAFRELLIHPTTFATVAHLLGHYSIQLQMSHLIEVLPDPEARVLGWHDDGGIPAIGVNGIRAMGSLKVGYYLTDCSAPDSGSLMVVPASHRMQGSPPFEPGSSDPVGAVQVRLKPGDAIVFGQGVWHASAPNRSDHARLSLYYGYSYRVLRPIDYVRMPAALLEGCDPVERQLLGETVTHQGYYVPTDADVPLRPWFDRHFQVDYSAFAGNQVYR